VFWEKAVQKFPPIRPVYCYYVLSLISAPAVPWNCRQHWW